jgi:hypothetical protein
MTALGSIHPKYKETRQPKIRNPQERGLLCKHLDLCLRQSLPFLSGKITHDVKELL